MFRQAILYIFIIAIAFVIGCEENNVENASNEKKRGNEQDYINVIDPNNTLAFSLLDKVEPDENNNTFISPTSALMALLMAFNGAEGDTKEEMAEALSIHGLSVEEANKANLSLLNMLQTDSEAIQLSIANSMWLNNKYHFTDEFIQKTNDYFQAEVTEVDIEDDSSVEKINQWVSDSTHGKIEEIIEAPIHPDVVTFLINALYFNGMWTHEFDEAHTEELPFYTPDGEKVVPLMVLEEELEYLENDQFQAVKLPYGKGEMSMNVFLPQENVQLKEILEDLTLEDWERWQAEFKETDGMLMLPKLEMEYEVILNNALHQLGIEQAFDEQKAKFPNIIEEDDPLFIHEVKQKTFIEVNEEGTEAAAATSIEMRTTSATLDDTFYMQVNRPFLFTITDEETNAILFIGTILSPEQRAE